VRPKTFDEAQLSGDESTNSMRRLETPKTDHVADGDEGSPKVGEEPTFFDPEAHEAPVLWQPEEIKKESLASSTKESSLGPPHHTLWETEAWFQQLAKKHGVTATDIAAGFAATLAMHQSRELNDKESDNDLDSSNGDKRPSTKDLTMNLKPDSAGVSVGKSLRPKTGEESCNSVMAFTNSDGNDDSDFFQDPNSRPASRPGASRPVSHWKKKRPMTIDRDLNLILLVADHRTCFFLD